MLKNIKIEFPKLENKIKCEETSLYLKDLSALTLQRVSTHLLNSGKQCIAFYSYDDVDLMSKIKAFLLCSHPSISFFKTNHSLVSLSLAGSCLVKQREIIHKKA